MTSRFLVAVAAVILAGYILAALHRWLAAQWFLVRMWRFLTGEAHHGHPVTDAGWIRHGQKALTRTGHAPRWWYLPRWKRTLHRSGGVAAVLLVLFSWLAAPAATQRQLAVLAVAGLALGYLRAAQRVRDRKQKRTWLYPLHLAAHEIAGHPRAIAAKSWITAELDSAGAVKGARLALPQGWPADEKDKQRLVAVTSAKLGIEAPETSWRLAGPAPLLTLTQSEPPPGHVSYQEIAKAVETAASNEIVVGIGKKGAVVNASLSLDSPHFAINMGTGGGKSNLAAFWLMQWLRRGALAMVLDSKWFSHPWLFKDGDGEYAQLPNVAYLSSPAELHAGMVWLGKELDRRNQVAKRAVDASGRMHGTVGAPIVIVAEELNFAMPQIRQYWADTRDPSDVKRSPALTALGAVAFAGRAVRMHLILIGQMLTAEVTGSQNSSVKENVGVMAMARYGQAGWNTAVGRDVPMPPPPSVLGRVQLAMAKGVRETQTPEGDGLLYRELAMSGTVTPCPAGMPGAVTVTGRRELEEAPDLPPETVSPLPAVAGGQAVTIGEAVQRRLVKSSKAALRMARFRDKEGFPGRVGARGAEYQYDAAELVAYDLARRS